MQYTPHSSRPRLCEVCGGRLSSEDQVCDACSAMTSTERAQNEARSILYLLSQLEAWKAERIVSAGQALELRRTYEERLNELLATERTRDAESAEPDSANLEGPAEKLLGREEARGIPACSVETAEATVTPRKTPLSAAPSRPRRSLFEMLSDPHTLRLLLFTGAAMLVVGIVIWLRDALYLKLLKPSVQALLMSR